MAYKTFQYRIYPSETQTDNLFRYLKVTRHVYNMGLEERTLLYELQGERTTKYDQYKWIKYYRRTFPQAQGLNVQALRNPLDDLDKAFKAFFRRVKAGEKPGYPKFKSWKDWHSICFPTVNNGYRVDGRRIYVQGIGRVRVRWDRPYEGDIKVMRMVHKPDGWYVSLMCEIPDEDPLPETGKAIGIDVGLSALLTMSNGEQIDNPQWYREAQAKLRRLQRRYARSKRGSNNRKKRIAEVKRWQQHIARQRKDFINKLVNDLVQEYDLIAIEDLRIQNMVKNKHLSKSIMDAGWGFFKERLMQKAAETGRDVVLVDPKNTSKSCSQCGHVFDVLPLSQRWVECDCGMSMDRDHNAAVNILKRARRARVA